MNLLHPKTLSGALSEGNQVAIKWWRACRTLFEPALGPELHWFGEDGLVFVH